jgi:hypothetical protein
MIRKDSIEWYLLKRKLNLAKNKTNRDSLCLKCWKIFTYEKIKKHRIEVP